jgi:phenylacetate-CoA ligase
MSGVRQQLRPFLEYAYEHAPGWRAWFDQHGIQPGEIVTESDLARVPVLKKAQLPALQQKNLPFAGLYAGGGLPQRIYLSPGPIYDPQPGGDDPWRFAQALSRVGFARGDVVLNAFSYHLSPAGFMFDYALRSLQAAVVPTGVGNTELLVPLLRDLRATGYVGTPGYFRALIQRAEEAGLAFEKDILIQKAFFTAEPIPDGFADWCEARHIRFGEAYGTADAGCIAYRFHPETGMQIESQVLLQICDPVTGQPVSADQPGEIVITVLDLAYPLIRLGTGDLSRWLPEHPDSRIAGVLGRVGDGVKVRGMFVYRQQIDQVLGQYPLVTCYQAKVTNDRGKDELLITVEMDGGPNTEMLDRISDHLREVLRVRAELSWVQPGTLDRGKNVLNDSRNG